MDGGGGGGVFGEYKWSRLWAYDGRQEVLIDSNLNIIVPHSVFYTYSSSSSSTFFNMFEPSGCGPSDVSRSLMVLNGHPSVCVTPSSTNRLIIITSISG